MEPPRAVVSRGIIRGLSCSRESRFAFRRSRVGYVAELRLDVSERREIGDVLCRLRGCVARSLLSVAKQLAPDGGQRTGNRGRLFLPPRRLRVQLRLRALRELARSSGVGAHLRPLRVPLGPFRIPSRRVQ
jgi:hypothetical protein